MRPPLPSTEKSKNHTPPLPTAAFFGGAVAGFFGAIMCGVSRVGVFTGSAKGIGAIVEFLVGFGILSTGFGVVGLVLARLAPKETLNRWVGAPFSRLFAVWNAPDPAVPGKLIGAIAGLFVFFFGVFFSTLTVTTRFNEPVRAAVLAAAIALAFLLVSRGVAHLVCRGIVVPVLVASCASPRLVARAALLAITLFCIIAISFTVLFHDEIFGAFDTRLPTLIVVFLIAASLSTHLPWRGGSFFTKSARLLVVSSVALVLGIAAMPASQESLGAVVQRGIFSSAVARIANRALDMDGDGFSWILGGDCHPLDAHLGPFAHEIPGNGIDENCDGKDTASGRAAYRDPLDGKKTPSRLIRPRGNVLVIIIDAARADHLATYGYYRNTMRGIDAMANQAAVFDHCYALSNHTSASMPALLTGLFPSAFPGIEEIEWRSFGIEPTKHPIQRRFARHGYETYMYAGHRLSGFLRGFEHGNKDRTSRVDAGQLSKMALSKLAEIGPNPAAPALFFIHYVDPHHPYLAKRKPYRFGMRSMDRYDGELAYVDMHLRRILSRVLSPAYKDWLIIVTSDHGEAFGEHGTKFHGFNLYDEEIRVPLIMRVPSTAPGNRSVTASHLDLLPTILDFTGSPPDESLQGRSLLPAFADSFDPAKRRIAVSEFFRRDNQFAASDGRYSLIFRRHENRFEFYDTKTDPEQRINLYSEGEASALKNVLMRHVAGVMKR